MASHRASGGSWREEEAFGVDNSDLTPAELRAIAENPNFNLTSVLQNPRETYPKSLLAELRDLDPLALYNSFVDDPLAALSDLASGTGGAADFESELDPGRPLPPPPVPLPAVTLEMFGEYLGKHGRLVDKYERNHRYHPVQQASSQAKGPAGEWRPHGRAGRARARGTLLLPLQLEPWTT